VDAIATGEIYTVDTANQIALYLGTGIATGRSYARSFPFDIENSDSFHRDSCNTHAFVAALQYAFKDHDHSVGLLVSQRIQEQVCRMLFLSELGFGRMLSGCLRYSEMTGIGRGTTAGTYGTFIKFSKAA
jgi:hypothetical protein